MNKKESKFKIIEDKIDNDFFDNPFFMLDRVSAVSNLMITYEILRRGPNLFNQQDMSQEEYNSQISAPFQSRILDRGLYFVFQKCSSKNDWDLENFYEELFKKERQFLIDPSFWALMGVYSVFEIGSRMFWRQQSKVRIKKHAISFRPKNEGYLKNMAFEALRINPLRNRLASLHTSKKMADIPNKLVAKIDKTLNYWLHKTRFLPPGLRIPSSVLEDIIIREVGKLEALKKVPLNWQFGKYTFEEFRDFWIYLDIKSSAILDGLDRAPLPMLRYPLFFFQSKRYWIEEICQGTELEPNTIRNILEDLTFDFNVPNLGVRIRPFVPLDNQYLALSPTLVSVNLVENNFLDLQAKTNRPQYEKLKNQKEQLSISEIERILSKRADVLCRHNIKIKENGRELTDIDLAAIELSSKSLVLFQLKWLMRPDTIFDTFKKDEEIEKGISQAKLAERHVRSNLSRFLGTTFACPLIPRIKNIFSIIVARDNIGSLTKVDKRFPVCDFDMLIMYLSNNKRPLAKICEIISRGEWLPKRGRDYAVSYRKAPLFDYFISMPSLDLSKKRILPEELDAVEEFNSYLRVLGEMDEFVYEIDKDKKYSSDKVIGSFRLFKLALGKQQLGHYEDAIKLYEQSIDAVPVPSALGNLGGLYYLVHNLRAAERCLTEALRWNPNSIHTLSNLSNVYFSLGEEATDEKKKEELFRRALNLLKKAASSDPYNDYLLYRLGCCYLRLKHLKIAAYLFNKSLKIKPGCLEAHLCLVATYHALADNTKLIEHLEQAAIIDPAQPGIFAALVMEYVGTNAFSPLTVEICEKGLQHNPDLESLHVYLLEAYVRLGPEYESKYHLALVDFVKRFPESPNIAKAKSELKRLLKE